ncbi:terminase large subunit [Solidesulfovibrio sp.]
MADRNPVRAQAVIDFIETLCIPEGMDTGKPFVLRPFQLEMVNEVYGPVDRRGLLLTRKAIYSVGKKNGKTPFIAGLAIAHLCGPEAKRNQQLYSAAYGREQAAITYRYMRQMIEMDDELSQRLIVRASVKEIEDPVSGSVFKALSSETKGKHGLGPALLIFDELAQFGADRDFYDTLIQGRGAHEEPLLWIISTQAADDKAVLSQEIDYALKVKAGEIDDPTVKVFLYTTPKDADLMDEEAWKLSNPALGDFLSEADMREAARTAKAMPSAEAGFRNLRLNQRCDAAAHFITPDVWKANGTPPDMVTFEDAPVTGGLDLSGKNDLTALIYTAQAEDKVWDVLPYFWTPADNLRDREDRDRVPYCLWRDQGFLNAVPGKTIDYRYVAKAIGEHRASMNIVGIKFDRWRIADLQRALVEEGVDAWIEGTDWSPPPKDHTGTWAPMPDGLRLIPHGQGFKDMSPAVEIVEDTLAEERMRHGMHPVLTMCAMNVRVQADPAGGRKFDKIKSTGRIDGLAALAMALNGATGSPPKKTGPSVYEERGFLTLGG